MPTFVTRVNQLPTFVIRVLTVEDIYIVVSSANRVNVYLFDCSLNRAIGYNFDTRVNYRRWLPF